MPMTQTTPTTAASAAPKKAGFPWLEIATIFGPTLLQMLLGKGGSQGTQQKQVTEQTTKESPRGYQSPLLGALDPLFAETLLNQIQGFSGAGMPGGKGSVSPNFTEFLALLKSELPLILEGYKKGGRGGMTTLPRRKIVSAGG